MTEKTGYKYSIKFNQRLTSGTIAFEGYYAFDEFPQQLNLLVEMLKSTEKVFAEEGYKIASSIPNNLQKLSNAKSDKK